METRGVVRSRREREAGEAGGSAGGGGEAGGGGGGGAAGGRGEGGVGEEEEGEQGQEGAGERARNRVRGLGDADAVEVTRHRIAVLHLQSRLVGVLSQWRAAQVSLEGARARGGLDMAGGWEEWREWNAECRECKEVEEECHAALQAVWDEEWQGSCPRCQGDVCCVMCTRGCGALRPCWGSNLEWPQGVVTGVGGVAHCGGLCVHAPLRAAWHTSVRQGALAIGARGAVERAEAVVVEAREVARRAAVMAVETGQYAVRLTSHSRSR